MSIQSHGGAPIFTAIWSAIVISEILPWFGYLGVFLIVAGIFAASLPVNAPEGKHGSSSFIASVRNTAAGWALAAAVFISIYSLSDKIVVTSTPPLIYSWWVFLGDTIFWAPVVWRRSRITEAFNEVRHNYQRHYPTSIMMTSGYTLVLLTLSLTSASYVVAGRGLSVAIAAFLGAALLKEKLGQRES